MAKKRQLWSFAENPKIKTVSEHIVKSAGGNDILRAIVYVKKKLPLIHKEENEKYGHRNTLANGTYIKWFIGQSNEGKLKSRGNVLIAE